MDTLRFSLGSKRISWYNIRSNYCVLNELVINDVNYVSNTGLRPARTVKSGYLRMSR